MEPLLPGRHIALNDEASYVAALVEGCGEMCQQGPGRWGEGEGSINGCVECRGSGVEGKGKQGETGQ